MKTPAQRSQLPMRCDKCNGCVVSHLDEVRCLNCGKQYFEADGKEVCSQGGNCGRMSEQYGLCELHFTQRLAMINFGRRGRNKYAA